MKLTLTNQPHKAKEFELKLGLSDSIWDKDRYYFIQLHSKGDSRKEAVDDLLEHIDGIKSLLESTKKSVKNL